MPETTLTEAAIPGYRAGTWVIDPLHSEVGFSIRHMMVSKVKGHFTEFEATITAPENPLEATVTAHAKVASVDTREPHRDEHLRTGDFFEAAKYPTIDFVSTAVRADGDGYKVDGELTIKGITKPVTFDFDFGGFAKGLHGEYRAGASAVAVVKREDFNLTYNTALETGGMLLGDTVTITLDLQATFVED